MKTILTIALLGMATLGSYAQTTGSTTQTQSATEVGTTLKNNGPAVFVRPTFDRPYRVLFNPPCIEYKRHGVVVLECPGILMAPESGDYDKSIYTGYGNTPMTAATIDNQKLDENGKGLTTK